MQQWHSVCVCVVKPSSVSSSAPSVLTAQTLSVPSSLRFSDHISLEQTFVSHRNITWCVLFLVHQRALISPLYIPVTSPAAFSSLPITSVHFPSPLCGQCGQWIDGWYRKSTKPKLRLLTLETPSNILTIVSVPKDPCINNYTCLCRH